MIADRLRRAAGDVPETPSYVIDLEAVTRACRTMIEAWSSQFPHLTLAYSYKTNAVAAVTRALLRAGAAAEVVSGSELELALTDGHTPDRIYFDGPYKSDRELARALALGVRIQVDSVDEARCLATLAGGSDVPARVSLRVAGLREGEELSRFGLTTPEVEEARDLLAGAGVAVTGLHFNTGYHDEDVTPLVEHLHHYANIVRRGVAEMGGAGRFVVDIGGGFPALSTLRRRGTVPHPLHFATGVGQAFDLLGIRRRDIALVIEPGRSLVEDHGVVVTEVVARKERGRRRIVVVDGGTNMVRSIGLWKHPVEILRPGTTLVDVAGSLCFENDYLGRDVAAPSDIGPGDRVLIGGAGGYDIPSANVWIRPQAPIYGLDVTGTPSIIRAPGEEVRS